MPPAQAVPQDCLKRLQKELKNLRDHPAENVDAAPDEENMLEWWYVFDGPKDTPYEGGEYVGKIFLSNGKDAAHCYPWKAPGFTMVTPNGRFKPNDRICTTFSAYHPETWTPSWQIASMLQGLASFMAQNEDAAGCIRKSKKEREKYAQASREFNKTLPQYKALFPVRYAKACGTWVEPKVEVKVEPAATQPSAKLSGSRRPRSSTPADDAPGTPVDNNDDKVGPAAPKRVDTIVLSDDDL